MTETTTPLTRNQKMASNDAAPFQRTDKGFGIGYAVSMDFALIDQARDALRGVHPMSVQFKNAVEVLHSRAHALSVFCRKQ